LKDKRLAIRGDKMSQILGGTLQVLVKIPEVLREFPTSTCGIFTPPGGEKPRKTRGKTEQRQKTKEKRLFVASPSPPEHISEKNKTHCGKKTRKNNTSPTRKNNRVNFE